MDWDTWAFHCVKHFLLIITAGCFELTAALPSWRADTSTALMVWWWLWQASIRCNIISFTPTWHLLFVHLKNSRPNRRSGNSCSGTPSASRAFAGQSPVLGRMLRVLFLDVWLCSALCLLTTSRELLFSLSYLFDQHWCFLLLLIDRSVEQHGNKGRSLQVRCLKHSSLTVLWF